MTTNKHEHRLPLLAQHDDALQRCGYCPKLCRATCPVSETEGRESVTPWGKMSAAWFMDRGDVPVDREYASLAWACTGCHACTERCDHANRPAQVLSDARAELFARDAAPPAARALAARFDEVEAASTAAAAEVQAQRGRPAGATAGAAVLVGCSYLRDLPDVATDALAATEVLLGGAAGRTAPAYPVAGCCGLPLLHAGDREGFERAARRLAARVRGASDFVVVDPGCAHALLTVYPTMGIDIRRPKLFVDLAADAVARLRPDPGASPPRWHDPCQLGRGLGRYDGPRAVLERIAGAPPLEQARRREAADCSGGGGLLPLTRPETSAQIAEDRIAEHHRLGGGTLVTACASSLRRFRASGEAAEDLASWVARGLGVAKGDATRER